MGKSAIRLLVHFTEVLAAFCRRTFVLQEECGNANIHDGGHIEPAFGFIGRTTSAAFG
jgi:hypothetical protein